MTDIEDLKVVHPVEKFLPSPKAMCNQQCPVRFQCKRHSASGAKPATYQTYSMFTPPPETAPWKCSGWWLDSGNYLHKITGGE